MGADIPKQFIRIGGKTILQLSLERVLEAVPDVEVVTVLPSEWFGFWRKECLSAGIDVRQSLVEGGITRFHSVRAALERVEDGAVVAVHDGVRPLVSVQLVRSLFDTALRNGSAVPVVPVVDTLKVLRSLPDGTMEQIPHRSADRSELFGAQTPQVFLSETLKAAYRQPFDVSFTDDASVVQACSGGICYVPGERYNIKITTPEDLSLAGRLLL